MKFNYIPIQPIIAEVQDEFKDMDAQGRLDVDTCYSSAVECIREIGGNQYEKDHQVLCVKKMLNALPVNFYLMQEVWELENANSDEEIFNIMEAFKRSGPNSKVRKRRLFAANDETMLLMAEGEGKARCAPKDQNWYILKTPPPLIRFGQINFTAGIVYYGLKRDNQGRVMMQDEINSIKAVKNFVLMTALRPGFLAGRVPQYAYQEVKQEYIIYIDQAQGVMKMPSAEDYEREVQSKD